MYIVLPYIARRCSPYNLPASSFSTLLWCQSSFATNRAALKPEPLALKAPSRTISIILPQKNRIQGYNTFARQKQKLTSISQRCFHSSCSFLFPGLSQNQKCRLNYTITEKQAHKKWMKNWVEWKDLTTRAFNCTLTLTRLTPVCYLRKKFQADTETQTPCVIDCSLR